MMDDWLRLQEKYPEVAFNWKNFDGRINSPENGFRILVQCEPWTNMPEQWDLNLLRRYEHVITFNRTFYEMYKDVVSISWMKGVLACNTHKYHLNSWHKFEDRLPGVCVLNNYYSLSKPGDILWLRPEVINNLDPKLVRHVWSSREWGGNCYQGKVEAPIHHSHTNHLKKISEYTFSLCLESTYHPFWSLDFITERIINCFKAKTIPIYMGCYNIQEHIPTDFFIDFRQYYGVPRRYEELSKLLLEIIHNKSVQEDWVERIEAAHEWEKKNHFGSVPELEEKLGKIL